MIFGTLCKIYLNTYNFKTMKWNPADGIEDPEEMKDEN